MSTTVPAPSPDADGQPRPLRRHVRPGAPIRVDAVMAFYNHGAFVREAVDSVRDQTHAVDRVIVVDDGSTDPASRAVLADLEGAGVIDVIRQKNAGPSAARNAGIDASDADALLIIDSDDRITPHYLEFAVAALAHAPDAVGFAYPDQQSFGTMTELAVMPRYNLYAISEANYCGTGVVVDAAVFEAGHRFREDIVNWHEDWEFYLRIGLRGISGVDFHGAPIHWRRWGYSRSESIEGYARDNWTEVRRWHPELADPTTLVSLKRRWSPALSILVEEVPETVAAQTCGDYECVGWADGDPPRVRGRWVLVLDSAGTVLLEDPTLVERLVRIVDTPGGGAAQLLCSGDLPGAVVPWKQYDHIVTGRVDGLVLRGSSYDRWRSDPQHTTRLAGAAQRVAALLEALTTVASSAEGVERRWTGVRAEVPGAAATPRRGVRPERVEAPLAPPAPPTIVGLESVPAGARARLEEDAALAWERECNLRWHARPLYLPRTPLRRLPRPEDDTADALGALVSRAWSRWLPPSTAGLDLVVDHLGVANLDVVYPSNQGSAVASQGARVPLGRIWQRNYPGTVALFGGINIYTHEGTYSVGEEPSIPGSQCLGYLSTEPFSDTVALVDRLDDAMRILEPLIPGAAPLDLELPPCGLYLEPADTDVASTSWLKPRGRLAPLESGMGGIGSTVYELRLADGRIRYSNHPDDAVAYPGLAERRAAAVIELAAVKPTGLQPVLQEVRIVGTGGAAYECGPIAASDANAPGPVLGSFSSRTQVGVPVVRLRAGPATQVPGEPGHRLALDWRPWAAMGDVLEGVVGYGWAPDLAQAPLYCWDDQAGSRRRLTLGEPVGEEGWELRGTLGLAWRPDADTPGLAPLWELARGDGTFVYAVDPGEFEHGGFSRQGIVCRLALNRRAGSVPLWRLAVRNDSPWWFTTCPNEGTENEYVRQGVIGFLDSAHPQPPRGVDTTGLTAGELPPDAVIGPVAFGAPVYRLHGATGLTTTLDEHIGSHPVEEVVAYLPPRPWPDGDPHHHATLAGALAPAPDAAPRATPVPGGAAALRARLRRAVGRRLPPRVKGLARRVLHGHAL